MQVIRKTRGDAQARVPELDGVRGIAIILVLLTHVFAFQMLDRPWTGIAKWVFRITVPGWLGVDLFFVLSGFLITGILLDSKEAPHYIRNFYSRRVLRIFPLYFVVLAALAIFYSDSKGFVLIALLMSANLAPLFHITVVQGGAPLWSLGVEEHFYLLWPWVVRFLRPVNIAVLCVGICVGEPILRAARSSVDDIYFYSWFRFDGLAWGALIAVSVHLRALTHRQALRTAAVAVVAAFAIAIVGSPFGILHRGNRLGAAFQFSLAQMFFAGALLAIVTLAGSGATAPLRWRFLTLSGDLSYCMYVTHILLFDLVEYCYSRIGDLASSRGRFSFVLARAAVTFALCYGVALVSRKYFERPILALKRYFPQQARKDALVVVESGSAPELHG